MTDDRHSRRGAREERARPRRRAALLSPLQQFVPGLGQWLLGVRTYGLIGFISAGLFVLAGAVLAWGFLVDRRVGFGWITQEAPLTAIIIIALVFGLVWLALGIDLAVRLFRGVEKRRFAWQGVLVVLVASSQLVALGAVAYNANIQRGLIATMFPTQPEAQASDAGPMLEPVAIDKGAYNILLLGGDAGAGRTGLRPDSITVASIDLETGATTLIGVPRNLQNAIFRDGSPLWGPFPDGYDCGGSCLISYLYSYGTAHADLYPDARDPGLEATRDAVEGVLGIEIPRAILIDMAGFESIVDAIGGIEVCVPVEVHIGDADDTVFPQGCQHMNGEQALKYARARHDSDDYNRMGKQRLIQEAILAQADPFTVLTNFQALASSGAKYVKTDIPQGELAMLLDVAIKARQLQPTTLELVPPTVDVVHPDFADIQKRVRDVLPDD